MRYGKQIKTNRDRLLLCGRRVASRPTSVVAARCLQRRPDTISRSGKDRKLIELQARSLIFEDTVRKLIVKSSEKPLELGYDDVTQVCVR